MPDPAGSRVIAVAGTSHSPMVTLDPALIWPARALTDVASPWLYDTTGVIRTYDGSPAGTGIGLAFGLWA
jgi:hypothetical protein